MTRGLKRKRAVLSVRLIALTTLLRGVVSGMLPLPAPLDQTSPAKAQGATVTRMSLAYTGTEGTGGGISLIPYWRSSSVSEDGTKVAFESNLAHLVPADGSNNADIFVKDTTSGEIELVSVPLPPFSPSGQSFSPSISADGRMVAFSSDDPNLVPGDSNGFYDVFVRDLQLDTTTLVSAGGGPANDYMDIGKAMISGDGTKVVFGSRATNLVTGGPDQGANIFLRDLVSNTTQLVSVSASGEFGNGEDPSVSADGRFVAFTTTSALLKPGLVSVPGIVRKDMLTGAVAWVSHALAPQTGGGGTWAGISADGQHVAFISDSNNFVENDPDFHDVFVWDAATNNNVKASESFTGGVANNDSYKRPSLSGDGRYVAFSSDASDLVPDDVNGHEDVFVRDLSTSTTTKVSTALPDVQSGPGDSALPWISSSGRFVSFESNAADLVDDDTNHKADIFLQRDPARLTGEKFVYVALGDSYSSGEGAGNSFTDADYFQAYDPGTYTPELKPNLVPPSDECHRALANYARINRDLLAPAADVVLFDQTCSGAKIQLESDDLGIPIAIPHPGEADYEHSSQVNGATFNLLHQGLTRDDVDLVTVGMGGNDANFGELVLSCLLPNVLTEALKAHENTPLELEALVSEFASCRLFDLTIAQSGPAIEALLDKEIQGQQRILDAFPNARVLQVNYPYIIPDPKKSDAICGGIRKEDLSYARQKIRDINKQIKGAVTTSAADHPQLQLVNLQSSLGANAMCPGVPSAQMAVGVEQANLKTEVGRLMDDSTFRPLVDNLIEAYGHQRNCQKIARGVLRQLCAAQLVEVKIAFDNLKAYFTKDERKKIQANMIRPGIPEDFGIRFDRSKGLFHPNALGHAAQASCILKVFRGSQCGSSTTQASSTEQPDTFNGHQVTNAPLGSAPGVQANISVGGFTPNTAVKLTMYSTPIALGTAVAGNSGRVQKTLTMPAAGAGVHSLEIEGLAAGGVGITQRIRVRYPGRPSGGDS